ncbi:hypothetical protein BD769DRAFT_1428856 [Suillus cothurnatus]|nr:hypothetical protein BD769DRAFT_1428856 [Suillus cothurnatus]
MYFSLTTVLALVAAFASSISAMPTDTNIGYCPIFCTHSSQCQTCFLHKCVSFSGLSSWISSHDSLAWKTFIVCTA